MGEILLRVGFGSVRVLRGLLEADFWLANGFFSARTLAVVHRRLKGKP